MKRRRAVGGLCGAWASDPDPLAPDSRDPAAQAYRDNLVDPQAQSNGFRNHYRDP